MSHSLRAHRPAAGEPERVATAVADHVAVVTLSRPEKHNALDLPMLNAIISAGERLRSEPGLRAVVLHGAGPSFCSGLDFPAVAAAGGLETFTGILDEPPPNYFQRAAYVWIDLPVPVIAAMHGNCLGGARHAAGRGPAPGRDGSVGGNRLPLTRCRTPGEAAVRRRLDRRRG